MLVWSSSILHKNMSVNVSTASTSLAVSCLFVGAAHGDIVISIAKEALIYDFLNAVAEQTQIPRSNRVFLAWDGTKWLSKSDPCVAAVRAGYLLPAIESLDRELDTSQSQPCNVSLPFLLERAKRLRQWHRMQDVFADLPVDDTVIHMLVCLPGSLVKWAPMNTNVTALDRRLLYFVAQERSAAFHTLLRVHEATAATASTTAPLPVALMDNVDGMGKTSFMYHYIRLCQQTTPSERPPYLKTLCNCHYIYVTARFGHQLEEEAFRQSVLSGIQYHLQSSFDKAEVCKRLRAASPDEFAPLLVKLLGPVVISVDSIGRCSFGDATDAEARATLIRFCDTVVRPWSTTGKIFFVLLTSTPCLSKLGEQCTEFEREAAKRIQFVRLPLHRLGADSIATILTHTLGDEQQKAPIAVAWRLTREDVAMAAELLYRKTSGHPGEVANVLDKYQQKREPTRRYPREELRESVDATALELVAHAAASELVAELVAPFVKAPPTFLSYLRGATEPMLTVSTAYLREFERGLMQWRTVLARYTASFVNPFDAASAPVAINLNQESGVDFNQVTHEDEEESTERTTLLWVLRPCWIQWEGTVTSATLFAKPAVMARILHVVFPLRAFAQYIAPCPSHFDSAVPWLCVKRLQELFTNRTEPSDALPLFFGSADRPTLLSSLGPVRFSSATRLLPQIREHCDGSWGESYIHSEAAVPRLWLAMMREITWVLVDADAATFTFPLQSASPDALLFMRQRVDALESNGSGRADNLTADEALGQRKRARIDPRIRTLVVGMVIVADVKVEEVDDGMLAVAQDEAVISHFDCIFRDIHVLHEQLGAITSVLLVVVTRATDSMRRLFDGRLFYCQDIQSQHQLAGAQAIYLDLTDRAKRARFFRWQEASDGYLLDAVDAAITQRQPACRSWRNAS